MKEKLREERALTPEIFAQTLIKCAKDFKFFIFNQGTTEQVEKIDWDDDSKKSLDLIFPTSSDFVLKYLAEFHHHRATEESGEDTYIAQVARIIPESEKAKLNFTTSRQVFPTTAVKQEPKAGVSVTGQDPFLRELEIRLQKLSQ